MRFLFVDLGSGWGGSERYLFWLMSALRVRGHWVGCVAPRQEFEPACDRLWITGSRFKNLGRARALVEAAGEFVDLVHFNADRAIHLAPFVRLPPRVATFATKHLTRATRKSALDLRTSVENRLTDLSLRRVARCICVSASMLAELTDAARARAVLIENGVPDQRPQHFVRSVTNRVAFLGRLSPEKGIADLLELARRCAARRPERRLWRISVAGTGPLADEVARAQSELPQGVLTYLGYQRDPARVYANAAALLLPSSHEGMPLVVLEAFSWGLPAVAYDIPGVRDVVADGRNGFLVRRADGVDGLERALDRLLGDPAGCVRLGATARADYDAGHRFETMIDKTIALLEQTAGQAAARRAG
ncbi:MAG TPA: glycosyltransferase family 4 protein [Gammaproteobacteria bacterium]|nr:glycosyltransferase family 4 protein [Gammaproteobacteria bacterium]